MNTTVNEEPVDTATLLDEPARRPLWRRPWPWVAVVLIAGAAVLAAQWQESRTQAAAPTYVTEPVARGKLAVTVSANGTLQPTLAVNIGSELSGTVLRVNVDVNDRVKKGQVLVELDTAKLRDQVARSRAAVAAADAKVAQTVATVKESQGNLARLEEVARLSGGKVPAQSELDTARATLDRARADENSARANVTDARAALSTDATNLQKASIRSPIDGVVLTRSVDPGNAVAASLQAVTLFSIAEDLTKLKLQVNVDETDVGTVQVGQTSSFTVGAYPNRRYPATVTRVAYGSTTTDNVVTYTTLLAVDNTDLTLRPGMTAVATIRADDRTDSLLVPNTALRFAPAGGAQAPARAASASSGSIVSKLMPRPPNLGQRRTGAGNAGNAGNAATGAKRVWVLRDGVPQAVAVTVGATDGRRTEVSGSGLAEGDVVITDQRSGPAP